MRKKLCSIKAVGVLSITSVVFKVEFEFNSICPSGVTS